MQKKGAIIKLLFDVGEDVYFLHENKVEKGVVDTINMVRQDMSTVYYVNNIQSTIIFHIKLKDGTILKFMEEQIHKNLDDLSLKLKEEFEKTK